MKILIAPDKFKGSLSAQAVGEAIARGMKRSAQQTQTHIQILADGGEGSLAIVAQILSSETITCKVQGPLGKAVEAKYLLAGQDAYIEMAEASGLVLLEEPERNALKTSTLGTGQLIRDAIDKGAKHIYLFLGGSATNDAGMGIAQALGFEFIDKKGQPVVPKGETLGQIARIKPNPDFERQDIKFFCLCDVQNPLLGPNGATYVYGPQKGANEAALAHLEAGMESLAKILSQHAQKEIAQIPGGGAAGGIAAGLHALLGAKIQSGIDTILALAKMEEKVKEADLVISGEGKLDSQTLSGKVINGLSLLCQKHQKPLWLFVGQHDLDAEALAANGVDKVFAVIDQAKDLEDAMQNTERILEELAFQAMELR